MAKQSASAEAQFQSKDSRNKKIIRLEFARFGPKGGKYTKEFFWIKTTNIGTGDEQTLKALTLEDIKRIAEEAENLIKIADGEDPIKL